MRFRNTLLALAATCVATWFAYAPGLEGGFLFDDLVNLPALGATGPVDDWPTFWRYITSGTADPTGRPLALLSFLLDANTWPAPPRPFQVTNHTLHHATRVVLFALLRILGLALAPKDGVDIANVSALLGAAAWLLHPLFVSTTLYIVQREAMLAALFVLLGLLAYAHGRVRFSASPRAGTRWMLAGLIGGTLLALGCKANGILLPLLAWVLEATIFSRDRHPKLRRIRTAAIVAPSLLLFAWLTVHFVRMANAPLHVREWTILQRVLTEPRALFEYIQLLYVPRAMSSGLFNDDYVFSTDLLWPASTLPALIGLVTLVVAAILLRHRRPALSAAVLFFFAGHALESSVLALELYFEHRNYLPAALAFWPLARGLCALRRPAWERTFIAVSALGLLAMTTHQRAISWGNPLMLARTWATLNPNSPRTVATAAMADLRDGRPDLAERRLLPALHIRPRELQLLLNLVDARCAMTGIDEELRDSVSDSLRHARAAHSLIHSWLERKIDTPGLPCRGIDPETLSNWIDDASANPAMRNDARRQDLAALRGQLALREGRLETARKHFDAALTAWPNPEAAGKHAAQLASHGAFELALGHLDMYEHLSEPSTSSRDLAMSTLHERVLKRQRYWDAELERLRKVITQESSRGEARR